MQVHRDNVVYTLGHNYQLCAISGNLGPWGLTAVSSIRATSFAEKGMSFKLADSTSSTSLGGTIPVIGARDLSFLSCLNKDMSILDDRHDVEEIQPCVRELRPAIVVSVPN